MKLFKVHTDKVHTYDNVPYWVYSLKRMISEGTHLNATKGMKASYKLALLKEEMKASPLFHLFHKWLDIKANQRKSLLSFFKSIWEREDSPSPPT